MELLTVGCCVKYLLNRILQPPTRFCFCFPFFMSWGDCGTEVRSAWEKKTQKKRKWHKINSRGRSTVVSKRKKPKTISSKRRRGTQMSCLMEERKTPNIREIKHKGWCVSPRYGRRGGLCFGRALG